MRRARVVAAAAALGLLATAGAARAWVRETTVNGNPGAGTCLWWGQRTLTYQVNATSAGATNAYSAPCLDATAASDLVAATLPAWNGATAAGANQACTDVVLQAGATTTKTAMGNDGVNLVVFRAGWCSSTSVVPQGDNCRSAPGACAAKYNCWEHDASGTIGLTTVTYNTSTGQILDADIEFHGRDFSGSPTGFWLTCATAPPCPQNPWSTLASNCFATDVGSVALHEAGHVLGLDHTCQYAPPYDACPANTVMDPTIALSQPRRTLSPDDVDGVCAIYPKGAATLTCPPVPAAPPHSSGGCSSAEGAGWMALLGVALAFFRTRHRARRRAPLA